MQSYPFTSQVAYDENGIPTYDRAVDATVLRNLNKAFFTNGVFPNPGTNFSVSAGSGMRVNVSAGQAHIEGGLCYETTSRSLTLQAADSQPRIDCVVLRLNDNTAYRSIDLYVVKGTPATTPIATEPTRTGGIYELVLAQVFIPANTVSVSQERITDTRMNTTICGYVNSIDTVDTSDIFNQYQAALDEYLGIVASAINETMYGQLVEQIGTKQCTITGAATSIDTENLTASRALVSNSSGKVAVSAVTSTELGYLDGVTSEIQTQINGSNTAITNHTGNSGIHVTSTDKSTWNGYQDQIDTVADSVAVNLLNMSGATGGSYAGITVAITSDGYGYTYTGTATGSAINVWMFGSYNNTTPLFTLKAGTYMISDVSLYNEHTALNGIVRLSSDTAITAVKGVSAVIGQTYSGETHYPMVEVGSVAHPWQPYIGAESIPQALSTRVEWESKTANQITVYGASTTNMLSASNFSGMNKVPDFCILQYQGCDPGGMSIPSSIYLLLDSFVKQTDDFTIILKATGQSDETRTFAPTFMFGYICGK